MLEMFLFFRLFYMEFLHELINHERCKIDNFRARWQYSWENIYHAKLQWDLMRVSKLVSMWSKTHNELRKS